MIMRPTPTKPCTHLGQKLSDHTWLNLLVGVGACFASNCMHGEVEIQKLLQAPSASMTVYQVSRAHDAHPWHQTNEREDDELRDVFVTMRGFHRITTNS
jgi:hypothetical protein